ncbi:MAG TPA: GNAT family N-acetyltransferase, partial [Candidatus Nanoarchaeia archaeon]|nr:GNAT family N-acetyltransferase [Candidatus Nanoarchaeia archaeon]
EDASMIMFDDFYRIEQQCFQEEAFSKQQIGFLLLDYNTVSLAARVDGELAGFIIARIDLIKNRLSGHIMTIDVGSSFRRMGVGQRLMMEAEAIFKQKGVEEVRLEVREGNAAAIALYEKMGYKKISRLEHYYGEAHGFYFRKTIP